MLLLKFINKIQESCIHLFLINISVNYYIFHQKILGNYSKNDNEFLEKRDIQGHLEGIMYWQSE